jgi:hypothetical protein
MTRGFYGDQWLEYFNQARTGASKVLTRCVKKARQGWGLGEQG